MLFGSAFCFFPRVPAPSSLVQIRLRIKTKQDATLSCKGGATNSRFQQSLLQFNFPMVLAYNPSPGAIIWSIMNSYKGAPHSRGSFSQTLSTLCTFLQVLREALVILARMQTVHDYERFII